MTAWGQRISALYSVDSLGDRDKLDIVSIVRKHHESSFPTKILLFFCLWAFFPSLRVLIFVLRGFVPPEEIIKIRICNVTPVLLGGQSMDL